MFPLEPLSMLRGPQRFAGVGTKVARGQCLVHGHIERKPGCLRSSLLMVEQKHIEVRALKYSSYVKRNMRSQKGHE